MASLSYRGRKNLRIYSWYSLPDLKHDQKCFIRISLLNVPEMRPLGTFGQFYQMVTKETTTVTKILTSALPVYFNDQNFQILCFCQPEEKVSYWMLLMFKKSQNLKGLTVNLVQGLFNQCYHIQRSLKISLHGFHICRIQLRRQIFDTCYSLQDIVSWTKHMILLV